MNKGMIEGKEKRQNKRKKERKTKEERKNEKRKKGRKEERKKEKKERKKERKEKIHYILPKDNRKCERGKMPQTSWGLKKNGSGDFVFYMRVTVISVDVITELYCFTTLKCNN